MEEYFINSLQTNSSDITIGPFFTKVLKKQKLDYGEENAKKTQNRVIKIFKGCKDIENSDKEKNILLVGKVQSGKTSNLELLTALSFDNGYDCVIIYGGYDTKLLKQTSSRFNKTFDINESDNMSSPEPILYSTSESDELGSLDDSVVRALCKYKKKLIFVTMKRPQAIAKIIDKLQLFEKYNLRTLIIDDEGDQASLNTEFKKNNTSATYGKIVEMKQLLKNPLYLSVTATPQANVLLGEYSKLKPEKIFLIEPGNGYTGANFFHLDDNYIVKIEKDEIQLLDDNEIPTSLNNAISYFFISSVLMKERGLDYSDMIIHNHRTNKHHEHIYEFVQSYLMTLKEAIENNGDKDIFYNKILNIYNNDFFDENILKKYPKEVIIEKLDEVILDTHVILQDSKGGFTQGNMKTKFHKIYIGGDLLQRGLTFKYLVTTYFTRWPKNGGNMDTSIQRARWFGYRKSYLDLCKVFTSEKIKKEFEGLTKSETDLWEQLEYIENGQLFIDDIVIDADSTSLNPTRKNVVNFKAIKFSNKWTSQKKGYFDSNINKHNNNYISNFFNKLKFINSQAGVVKGNKISCQYCYLTESQATDLFLKTSTIFCEEPFNQKELLKIIKNKKIVLQKMCGLDGDAESFRYRSFYRDTKYILALQQGPDDADEKIRKYSGDAKVIVDEDAVTIQVFKICPRFDKKHPLKEHMQYMFAIHSPEKRKGFIKYDN